MGRTWEKMRENCALPPYWGYARPTPGLLPGSDRRATEQEVSTVALHPLTPEQRAEALKKAAEARRERAASKARLKDSAGRRGEEISKVHEAAETKDRKSVV